MIYSKELIAIFLSGSEISLDWTTRNELKTSNKDSQIELCKRMCQRLIMSRKNSLLIEASKVYEFSDDDVSESIIQKITKDDVYCEAEFLDLCGDEKETILLNTVLTLKLNNSQIDYDTAILLMY